MAECKSCHHWNQYMEGSSYGFCTRYPPVALEGGVAAFPPTEDTTRCGEFLDKEIKAKRDQREKEVLETITSWTLR